MHFGSGVHRTGTVCVCTGTGPGTATMMEQTEKNTLCVKLLHLFTIPFGVYEKDRQTEADILAR